MDKRERRLQRYAKEMKLTLKNITENDIVKFALPGALTMEIEAEKTELLIYFKGVKTIISLKEPNKWNVFVWSPIRISMSVRSRCFIADNLSDKELTLTLIGLKHAVEKSFILRCFK